MNDVGGPLLESVLVHLRRHKDLAERAIAQVTDAQLHRRSDPDANSIAILMQHLAGNMRSRWTDFLATDGEKPDRDRDGEFVDDGIPRAALLADWEGGWAVTFGAIEALRPDDLERTITIRGRELTVLTALHRQLAHYAYHTGQIVHLARTLCADRWVSLSIPRRSPSDPG